MEILGEKYDFLIPLKICPKQLKSSELSGFFCKNKNQEC